MRRHQTCHKRTLPLQENSRLLRNPPHSHSLIALHQLHQYSRKRRLQEGHNNLNPHQYSRKRRLQEGHNNLNRQIQARKTTTQHRNNLTLQIQHKI